MLQDKIKEIIKRSIIEKHVFTPGYGPYIDTVGFCNIYGFRIRDILYLLDTDNRFKEYDAICYKFVIIERRYTTN